MKLIAVTLKLSVIKFILFSTSRLKPPLGATKLIAVILELSTIKLIFPTLKFIVSPLKSIVPTLETVKVPSPVCKILGLSDVKFKPKSVIISTVVIFKSSTSSDIFNKINFLKFNIIKRNKNKIKNENKKVY